MKLAGIILVVLGDYDFSGIVSLPPYGLLILGQVEAAETQPEQITGQSQETLP